MVFFWLSYGFSCDKKVYLKTYDVINIMPFPVIVVLSFYQVALDFVFKAVLEA